MDRTCEMIYNTGVIPVIRLNSVNEAAPLARALCDGGVPVAEVTFRSGFAEAGIRSMALSGLNIAVGAGTVLTVEQIKRARDAGAAFIVTPAPKRELMEYCAKNNILMFPGCAVPGDIELAVEYGFETVKIFPAEPLGGVKYLKALAGPYSHMRFIPTGGIGLKEAVEYIAYEKVFAVGGSWLASQTMLEKEDFAGITQICKDSISAIVGMKCDFSADGKPGEIIIKTSSVERAIHCLKMRGFDAVFDTVEKSGGGVIQTATFSERFGDKNVRLLRNN